MIDIGTLFNGIITEKEEQPVNAEDVYNWLMRQGLYQLAALISPIGAVVLRVLNLRGKLSDGLVAFWRERPPAAVVSFVPTAPAVLRSSLLRACPKVPLITVVTDMASSSTDLSGHRWIEPYDRRASANHTIVAGTAPLQERAAELGYPPSHVLATSGMVVHPDFYRDPDAAGQAPLQDAPGTTSLGVIFFGGTCPGRAETIAVKALAAHPKLRLVVCCGSNKALVHSLRALGDARCTAEGFITPQQIRDLFRAADFVLGKPGPGVVAEALVCGVPYVTESTAPMAQEVCVLDYLRLSGAGVLVPSFESLPPDLLARCARAREATRRLRNSAVFELAGFLETVVRGTSLQGQDQTAQPQLVQRGRVSTMV